MKKSNQKDLTNNAKLAQSGRQESVTQRGPTLLGFQIQFPQEVFSSEAS